MRALIINHDITSYPAMVGECLEARGVRADELAVAERAGDPVSHRPFPELDGYDLVVAMGSVWSVYNPAAVSWVEREAALLNDAIGRGLGVLGICFGGQLLSAVLGGAVERAPRPELGWCDITTDDPVTIPPGPWFQWHYDRFTVPAGAVELARSDVCPQAFRYGRALGLQFHPEADAALLECWLDDTGRAEVEAAGLDPDELLATTGAMAPLTRPRTAALVDAFLDAVYGAAVVLPPALRLSGSGSGRSAR